MANPQCAFEVDVENPVPGSSVVFRNGMKSSHPALLTTTSIAPNCAVTSWTASRTEAVSVTSMGTTIASPPAATMRAAVSLAASTFRVCDGDAEPVGAEGLGDSAADALGTAGDECDSRSHVFIAFPWLRFSGRRAVGDRGPVHRTGHDAVAGELAAQDRLRRTGGVDDRRETDAGLHAHLVEHVDQVLGGDVAG